MCSNPRIQHIRLSNGSYRLVEIPCGKCLSCVCQKQNALAGFAYLGFKNCPEIYLLTFTYDNDNCPIQKTLSEYTPDGEFVRVRERSVLRFSELPANIQSLICQPRYDRKSRKVINTLVSAEVSVNTLNDITVPLGARFIETYRPTLLREDIRLAYKRYRVQYTRESGKHSSFRHITQGEYGGTYFRPHYHCLCKGVDSVGVDDIIKQWPYGRVDKVRVTRYNNKYVGDNYNNVARYVSKYLVKPSFCLHGDDDRFLLCEKPRRMVSKHFAVIPAELLAWYRFEDVKDIDSYSEDAYLAIVHQRSVFELNGFQFPMCASFKRQIYQQYSTTAKKYVNYPFQEKRLVALSDELSRFVNRGDFEGGDNSSSPLASSSGSSSPYVHFRCKPRNDSSLEAYLRGKYYSEHCRRS